MYCMFGFLLLAFVVLVVVSAEISIIICYFHLCSEYYHWWWRSFFSTGTHPFSLPPLPPQSYWWVQPFLQSVSPSLSSSLTSSLLLVGRALSSVCLSLTLFLLTLTGGSNPFFSLSLPHSLPPLPPHSYWWVQPFLQSVSPSLSSSLASSLLLVGPALSSVCLSLTFFLPCLLTLTGGSYLKKL